MLAPVQKNDIPSVAMNDGILVVTTIRPLTSIDGHPDSDGGEERQLPVLAVRDLDEDDAAEADDRADREVELAGDHENARTDGQDRQDRDVLGQDAGEVVWSSGTGNRSDSMRGDGEADEDQQVDPADLQGAASTQVVEVVLEPLYRRRRLAVGQSAPGGRLLLEREGRRRPFRSVRLPRGVLIFMASRFVVPPGRR